MRIDQDTLTMGPFFQWLQWQKASGWPDLDHVIWRGRDSGVRRDQVPLIPDDLHFYINHHDTRECPHNMARRGRIPKRPKYKAKNAVGEGANWGECGNAAVGVYGYPVELMKDVRGMNERMIYWGGMESELCTRASKSKKFVNWVDLHTELCGPAFAHMEHDYGRKQQGTDGHECCDFDNNENWGLANETLLEYVY